MIDFLRGVVAHREAEYAVIDVNGVGYQIFCPNPYVLGEGQVTVYTHHHVREDAILLFGFASREEQALFRKLIEVTGIGPKVAVGILSGGRPEAVVAAIQQENIAFLTKLPGIGKKTAQRMILDLKDKLSAVSGSFGERIPAAIAADPTLASGTGAWQEAREALLALGYTEAEVDRAWPGVKEKAEENAPADTLVKLALQRLYAG